MKCDDHSPADEIFNAALDLDTTQRREFLTRACSHRPSLLKEVQSLLDAYEHADGFLETPVLRPAPLPAPDSEDTRLVGALVGPYRLLSLIAAGGMGAVYKARREDGSFQRQVAVKLIRRGMINDAMRKRFHRERQTLAGLEHPFIARLLDGGETEDGMPYLVMELIAGLPITEYCEVNNLTIRERLGVFCLVCEAVHQAHRNLIIHRDLKPGNILVTEEGRPKLLDFGIARLLGEGAEHTGGATLSTSPAMTPRYASPEQIRGSAITTGTDVYSLGVILHELLTGRSPYSLEGKSRFEQDRIICEVTPEAPSQHVLHESAADTAPLERADAPSPRHSRNSRRLARIMRGDLDRIVLTALQKDPNRRYASALQFKEDVERYLAGMPIVARKVTLRYRAMKYVLRNKAASLATAAFALMALAAVLGTSVGFVRARKAQESALHERNSAVRAEADARAVTAFMQDLLAAANPYDRGRDVTVGELLADAEHRIAKDLGAKPAIEAGVRLAIASTYAGMWQWDKVIPHARIALSLNRRVYGNEDDRVADCLNLLGRALTFARDPEAVAVQEEGLAIREKIHGKRHPAVAESTGNLGFALWHALAEPRWKPAESHYRASLRLYRELGIQESSDVARFTFSLAAMLSSLGRFSEAEPLFQEALAMYERLPGPMDRYRMECMRNYAIMLERAGRIGEAERFIEQALTVAPQQDYSAGFRSLKWTLGNLYLADGKPQEAMRQFRRTLVDGCLRIAADHPELRERMKAVADDIAGETADVESIPVAVEAIGTSFSHPDSDLLNVRINLATVFRQTGNNRAGIAILEPFANASASGREQTVFLAVGQGMLGSLLTEEGELERAEPLLIQSHETLLRLSGKSDRQTKLAAQRIEQLNLRKASPLSK